MTRVRNPLEIVQKTCSDELFYLGVFFPPVNRGSNKEKREQHLREEEEEEEENNNIRKKKR